MMKNFVLLCGVLFFVGCASVGTHYTWDPKADNGIWGKGAWIPDERYVCKGSGCEVDFSKRTMKGGALISLPKIELDN